MRFEWDEAKRKSNLKTHGLDFADAELVFGGLTTSYEDDRFRLLRGAPVSIVHTESPEVIRSISFRRATHHETAFFFETIADYVSPTADKPKASKGHGGTSGTRSKTRRSGHRKKRSKTRPS
jgi:hypothetical protein